MYAQLTILLGTGSGR